MVGPALKATQAWPASTELDTSELTIEQSMAIWRDLMDSGEQMVLAALREELGQDADVRAAYQRWYEEQMRVRDREVYGIGWPLNLRR